MIPYYADDTVQLHLGDWRELIDERFVADLIGTDPPYGETSLDWDRWPDDWPTDAAGHARSMWCFGSMRMFLDRRDDFGAWKLSQDIVWEKHNGSGFHADRFRRVHEHITHWYRGDWSSIHHDVPTTPDATARTVRRKGRPAHTGQINPSAYSSVDGGPRLMTSVQFHPSMHGNAINETEKPVGLLEPLIAYGCRPGGLVLDPFAGSGSTLEACRRTGRRAIGYEIREDQCERTALRLSQGVLPIGGTA